MRLILVLQTQGKQLGGFAHSHLPIILNILSFSQVHLQKN